MKKNVYYLLFILFFFNGSKCIKSNLSAPSVLPPITQEGKNTFGCLVNGKVWVPFFPCYGTGINSVEALSCNIGPLFSDSSLPIFFSVDAGNYTPDSLSYFSFHQNGTLSDHIYGPGNIIDSILIRYVGGKGVYYNYYYPYPGASAPRYFQVTKLDTINKIISGVFAFTLYAQVSGNGQGLLDSVIVSEGRFDLAFGQLYTCSQ